MKVLIISQPVLSKTNNMGKTLMGYFRDFSPDDISQLYLHEGIPENTDVCEKYYCYSDSDAMKYILDNKEDYIPSSKECNQWMFILSHHLFYVYKFAHYIVK